MDIGCTKLNEITKILSEFDEEQLTKRYVTDDLFVIAPKTWDKDTMKVMSNIANALSENKIDIHTPSIIIKL